MEWFEDDAFWVDFAPILFNDARRAGTSDEVDGLIRLAGAQSGATVLDLACGLGRHAIELARRGHRVAGVDRTRPYLDRAAADAAEAGVEVEWIEADVRSFVREGAWDVVACLFTSFGYFDDPADDERVLANVHASLAPGGRFVIDVLGKEILARGWQQRYWTWLDDGRLLLEERRVLDDWTRVRTDWTLLGNQAPKQYFLQHRLYAGSELRALLERAGFANVRLYGGLDGSPYDERAWRLVAVASR